MSGEPGDRDKTPENADAFDLDCGAELFVMRSGYRVPDALLERTVPAETLFLSEIGGDYVVLVAVAGETAIRVVLTRGEAFLYCGMVYGISARGG